MGGDVRMIMAISESVCEDIGGHCWRMARYDAVEGTYTDVCKHCGKASTKPMPFISTSIVKEQNKSVSTHPDAEVVWLAKECDN